LSIELSIERLAYGGKGVSHLPNGKTVFVEGACPGDVVEAEVTAERANLAEAKVAGVLSPSPQRIAPKCPYSGLCGGCPWQIVAYDTQLEWKRRFVVDSLTRIGGFADADEIVRPCIRSNKEWEYRNKVELVSSIVNGRLSLGFHASGSDEVVPVTECKMLPRAFSKAPKSLAGALRYLKADEYGLERVGVRISTRTGEAQIALWTEPGGFPRAAAANVLKSSMKHNSLVRVLVKGEMKARQVKGVELLDGIEQWHERLGDMHMGVSAPSFFQVNTRGAESLIALVMDGLGVEEGSTACDLYCGAGTFTLPLAERCDEVFAIEAASSSVRDLRRNLDDNGLDAEVIGGDAARESAGIGQVDHLVVDPPYAGLAPEVFDRIEELSPGRIAMVSCNPTTLARDLKKLVEQGYAIERVTPVDLFPQTFHVESVAILSR
jgi:23S rRNA (uracil1939-C5)-methyltransferase